MAEIRKVQKIGHSPGIYLPRDMLNSLDISMKDYVYIELEDTYLKIYKLYPKKGIKEGIHDREETD